MLAKIIELLSLNTNLRASAPYVLRLIAALAALVLIGAFACCLTALVIGFGLWMIYDGLRGAGYPTAGALSAAVGVFVVILVIVIVAAQRLWGGLRRDLYRVIDVNTPPAARAVNSATTVASSFLTGLMRRRREARAAKTVKV